MVHSIREILTRTALCNPRQVHIKTASTTRTLSDVELDYPENDKLSGIVFCPQMLDTLVQKALQVAESQIKLTEADAKWISQVDPQSTHNYLTPVICSEMDSREWIKKVWLLPALAVVHACEKQGPVSFPWSPSDGGPHITSAQGEKGMPIPDDVLYRSLKEFKELDSEDRRKALQTYEYKTSMALKATTFDQLHERYQLQSVAGVKKDYVVPFIWPTKGSGTNITKATKMIAQVYCQMKKYKVNQAILSSYDSTTFLYLRTITKRGYEYYNVLHVSPTYQYDQPGTFAAIFAWLCLGLGIFLDNSLQLPELDWSCVEERSEVEHGEISGADYLYMRKYMRVQEDGTRKTRSCPPVSPPRYGKKVIDKE